MTRERGSIYRERGRWIADYRDDCGKRRRESCATQKEALALLSLRREQIAAGAFRVSILRERANLRRGASMTKKWKGKAYKARVSRAITAACASAESRGKKSAASQANWRNPPYRQAVSASAVRLASDPVVNGKRRRSMRRRWSAAGYRESVSSAMSRRYLSQDYQARNLAGRLAAAQRKGIFLSPPVPKKRRGRPATMVEFYKQMAALHVPYSNGPRKLAEQYDLHFHQNPDAAEERMRKGIAPYLERKQP